MSIFDFCGVWIERPDGDSLEPLMRAMKVKENKIQESFTNEVTCSIYVKNNLLITNYKSKIGEVTSSFVLNGGWVVTTSKNKNSKKQSLTRCSYGNGTLIIEKKVGGNRSSAILRDERRVEKDGDVVVVHQKFELVPKDTEGTSNPSISALRVWEKLNETWKQDLLDKFRGVWETEENDDPSVLKPIFEAMKMPPGAIRTALALKLQHSIFVCGPNEVLFVNQSQHGDLKSASHVVRETKSLILQKPDKGHISCFAYEPNKLILLSLSLDGCSLNRDERTISNDGLSFEQRMCFTQDSAEPIEVVRRWKRARSSPRCWKDDLPLFKPGGKRLTSIPSSFVSSLSSSPVSNPPSQTSDQEASLLLIATTKNSQTVNQIRQLFSERFLMISLLMIFSSCLNILIQDDDRLYFMVIPLYILVRSMFSEIKSTKTTSIFQDKWVMTSILFFIATVSILVEPENAQLFFLCITLTFLSRFYSGSRGIQIMNPSDQWVGIMISFMFATLFLSYGLPIVLNGEDEEDPSLGTLTLLSVLVYVGLRYYAKLGPPPVIIQDDDLNTTRQQFSIEVSETRYDPTKGYGEYLVVTQMEGGQRYEVWRRFSSFHSFRKSIRETSIKFPPKRLFGNSSESLLNQRKIQLNYFLSELASNHGQVFFETSHEARAFIGAPPA